MAAALTLVGASVGLARRAHPDRCGGSEALVAGAWDDAVRAQLRTKFAAAVPGSSPIVASVERTLDAYTGAWVKMRTESCQATRVREEQPESVLVLRTACLDSRLRELRSFTAQLAEAGEADKTLVLKAAQAAGELTSIAPCGDVAGLTAVAPPPKDPAALALVHKAENTLSEARALQHLGKDTRAVELAAQALADAQAAHYAPLEAKARNAHGSSLMATGEHKAAEAELSTAFAHSLAAKDDETATKAATSLASLESYMLARPLEGERWAEIAHGALERAGERRRAARDAPSHESWAHDERWRRQGGRRSRGGGARRLRERLYGKDSLRIATFLNALGSAYDKVARLRRLAKRARASTGDLAAGARGTSTRTWRRALGNIAEVDVELGDFAAAKPLLEQAVDLYTRIRGPNHPNVAIALGSLGDALDGARGVRAGGAEVRTRHRDQRRQVRPRLRRHGALPRGPRALSRADRRHAGGARRRSSVATAS